MNCFEIHGSMAWTPVLNFSQPGFIAEKLNMNISGEKGARQKSEISQETCPWLIFKRTFWLPGARRSLRTVR